MNVDSLEVFKALDYPVKIEYDSDDSLFIAGFLDLPGCSATGSTVEEAYARAQEAKAEWLRVTLEQGLPIPKPSKTREHSGRILLRLPISLHAVLSNKAGMNGTSLNQYIVHLLSAGAVGDEVSSKLDAVARHVRKIESCMTAEFAQRLSGMAQTGSAQSEGLGHPRPKAQAIPLPAGALESARIA